VLGDRRLGDLPLPCTCVLSANPRLALARMASRWAGRQPETVVAVTGTNGKSSIVAFARQLWAACGIAAASVGTLGVVAPSGERPLGLTTPDPVELHAILAELARAGVSHAALEASSHALAQYRLDGVRLRAAAFSNLTRDHFDYHGSFEAYAAAKARLFEELLPAGAAAVLNADVPLYARLAAIAAERRLELVDYGAEARRIRLLRQTATAGGQRLEVAIDGRRATIESRLVGDFQAHNLLAAAGLALATGNPAELILDRLGAIVGARGRMELAARLPNGAAVYVDYAHTPDALARVLQAARPHTAGRLAVVFGAGGDRDIGKRPLMGEAAAAYADRVYVTDDNPRSEDPARIRAAVLAGCREVGVDAGPRRVAIGRALAELGPGDVLVVAGKGHEPGQTIAGVTHAFDDVEVVRELSNASAGEAA
jgi:UDP-N-acetylmuramoyl-L-alanyl-D-glutamate--2,6-diaminopimelate ligase